MGMNKMEFQWRLNWWYRPTQLDGFRTSVADYYDCFCYWKAHMELNECLAAFIQNLRCDIQSRLPKYIFSGGLFCAFLAAKLEESMMRIDEAFKKNGAHKSFDEMPSQVSANCQENLPNEEFSGLEDDDNDSSTAYGTSIDEIGEEENDEMLVKLEENPVKDVSLNADDKVFDELPKSALTTTSYKLLDDDFNVYSELNSQTGATFDQVLGSSGDEAWKLLTKSTGIQLMEKVEGLFSAIPKDSGVGYKVFDEMPRLFFVEPNEQINGDMDSITQIDCLPRVFDPGISISFKDVGAAVIETTSLHNELLQPSITATTGLKSNSGQCRSFATFLGQCKTISFTSNDMVIIFDPGGRKNGIHNLGSNQCSKVIEEYTAIAYLENPSSIVTKINKLDVEFWPGKILMFVFDPGGCGEPFGFWIEGVVGMLYCHLLECLVSCLWSHIISLVDERKRANMALKNGVVGSSVKSSKLLTELLMHYIFWTRGALNLDDVELVEITFGIVLSMIQPGVGLNIAMDVGLHFQRSLVEFSQEGLSTLTNMEHWMYVGSGIIGFSYRKAVVQGVVYRSIQSHIPLLINPGKVFLFVLHRPDDEAEFGQTALVVLNPSSMIEMCLVHLVPNLFYDSSSVMEIEKKLLLTKFKGCQDSRVSKVSLHILEDNDVFEGVGNGICCMEDMEDKEY